MAAGSDTQAVSRPEATVKKTVNKAIAENLMIVIRVDDLRSSASVSLLEMEGPWSKESFQFLKIQSRVHNLRATKLAKFHLIYFIFTAKSY